MSRLTLRGSLTYFVPSGWRSAALTRFQDDGLQRGAQEGPRPARWHGGERGCHEPDPSAQCDIRPTQTPGGKPVIGPLKTRSSRRTVPVSDSLLEEIRRHIEQFLPAEDGRVFTTNGAKDILSDYPLIRAVAAAAVRAGIHPAPNAHQLRDFAASILIKGHASVKQVQRFLGHSSAAMTLDKFVDLWPGDLGELADIMDRALTTTPALVAVQ